MRDDDALLDREAIHSLLDELALEMEGQGLRAELFLVGGAAMALAYDERRATRDLDAVFVPKAAVYAAARRVAERRGLDPDWLNDGVMGFLLGDDVARRTVFERPGCVVMVASPQYLLAMKVFAARVDRDAADILFLARECGLTTGDAVLDMAESYFAGRPVPPKVHLMVEELFNPAD